MTKSTDPIAHRANRRIRQHVPDFHVCVIYRGESYAGVRGPGYFFVNPLTERTGEIVSTKPRAKSFRLEHLFTSDPIPIELAGKLSFTFDPREGDAVPISRLVRLPAATLDDALGSAVQELVFKAVRSPVNAYSFENIQRGETLAQLEAIARTVNDLPGLYALGIQNVSVMFTHAVLPDDLQKRLGESAQRRYNTQISHELEQADLLRALIIELVEKVSRDGNLEQLFNFTEAVNTLRQIESRPAAPPALEPANPKIIDAQVFSKPPSDASPPNDNPTPPDTGTSTAKPKRSKPKSPSYLDPDG